MSQRPLLSFSLRFTLIAQFVICALLPLVVLSAVFISSFRAIQIEQQIEKQQAIANCVMVTTQFATEKAELALEQIARDKNIALAGQSGLFGYSAANALYEYVTQHQFVTAAMLLDANNEIVEAAPTTALRIPTQQIELWLTLSTPEPITQIAVTSQYQPELAQYLRNLDRPQQVYPLTGHFLMLSIPLFLSETESLDSRSTYTGTLVAFILADDLINLLIDASEGLTLSSVYLNDVALLEANPELKNETLATEADLRIARSDNVIKAVFSQPEELALSGVDPEALPKLFEPLYTTSRQAGGSGLGLSIVYNLATQRLGGKINCYCEPDDGPTIFIEFPVKAIDVPTSSVKTSA